MDIFICMINDDGDPVPATELTYHQGQRLRQIAHLLPPTPLSPLLELPPPSSACVALHLAFLYGAGEMFLNRA